MVRFDSMLGNWTSSFSVLLMVDWDGLCVGVVTWSLPLEDVKVTSCGCAWTLGGSAPVA